jgi:predicted SAM-dependent methyltransferase
VRLHLGCGGIHLDGWVNVDRRYLPGVDRVDNIAILRHGYENVAEIYACHALDHFDRWTYPTVLRRWFQLLKPGGVLRISTPDFEWAANRYEETGDLRALTGQLYAGQDYPDNVRHWAWDFRMATEDLTAAGFVRVDEFEPFAPDASALRDERGRLRSLNVEAYKPDLTVGLP